MVSLQDFAKITLGQVKMRRGSGGRGLALHTVVHKPGVSGWRYTRFARTGGRGVFVYSNVFKRYVNKCGSGILLCGKMDWVRHRQPSILLCGKMQEGNARVRGNALKDGGRFDC